MKPRSVLSARVGRFVPTLLSSFAALASSALFATPVAAATKLTVDLSTSTGPVTHAASGSLYGVTEKLPADVMGLIAPLHPKMFNNPAADQQQPVGDAIVVAGLLAPTGATVTIRLADWFKGFYTFTTMADWFDKIGQTVSRKKAANLTNIYAYEIWNEPNGTYASNNPLSFNEFWRQTFVKLRELDPDVKITGPSLSYYNEANLKSFLSFCKTNSCLPDIVGWHELGGGNLTGTLQSYRALEKDLGIGPLPISINEYSGGGHLDVEGQPGASAPLIAKFERFGVDSACISFWDVPHPGRLGSLLATNTDPNGGWWFYKWYGDMAGKMVSTTPATPQSATELDGFANLDAASGSASVLFGGVNDGSIQIVVTGFKAAPYFGNTVHAVVEHTPFASRSTVVKAVDTLSTADLPITNDQITITVANANAKDGYRLKLTSLTGGTGGAGGAGGTGGAGGASSASGAGGASSGSGGMKPNTGGGGVSTGGNDAGGSGASDALGGAGLGGLPNSAGGGVVGGASGIAGNSSTPGNDDKASGCTCQLGRSPSKPPALALLLLVSAFTFRRKRARRGALA